MIFPQPQKFQFHEEKYTLKTDFRDYPLLEFYRAVKSGVVDISVKHNSMLKNEEHTIKIDQSGITVTVSTDEGLYRAATSVLQMIKKGNGTLPHCEIEDFPQLPHRGYMLDISRCRMPKVETIKEIVDYISALKYNEFQLYMEGHVFKYKEFPEYTAAFDCLTPDDIEEIDRYCKERFIDFVPNQNSLGHLYQWLSKEELTHLAIRGDGVGPGTINPLKPESLDFIDKLYSSVLPHYSSEYVNVGLDEAYGLGKCQTEEYCKEHGKDVLFMEWLNKVAELAKKYGKNKVMFWADMIYKFQNTYDMIPKDAVLLEWGYELIQSQRMTEHCITFKNAGLNYYVCPSCNTHLTFTGRTDVTTFNIRTAAEIASEQNASGLLLTDWGNGDGHPHFWVWSAVPIALAGQYSWNVGIEQDGEKFKAEFIKNSEKYVDDVLFGGKRVSNLLYRMGNYYLLEPERVHCCTMCGGIFKRPLSETNFNGLFDLKDSGDAFYFDNVTEYVKKVLADIEKVEFDERLKREIIINSKMVILSSELCKVRIGCPISDEKKAELVSLIDWMADEYRELWCFRNFEKGIEDFENQLAGRKAELLAL